MTTDRTMLARYDSSTPAQQAFRAALAHEPDIAAVQRRGFLVVAIDQAKERYQRLLGEGSVFAACVEDVTLQELRAALTRLDTELGLTVGSKS